MILNKKKKNLDNSFSQTQIPGVEISFVTPSAEKINQGKLEDGKVCFDVDENCKIIKDECFRCVKSIYPVIASSCTQKVRRYCGAAECGTKNNPACIRGFKASGYSGPYCINDSPIGYCEKPLRVMCINRELICR